MYADKTKERLHKVWWDMRHRCYTPTHHNYYRYGGRGIKICDEWLVFENFYQWAINNGYKVELLPNKRNKWSIDRIDNDKNYCPENCRWTDIITQQYNKATTVYYKYKGKKYNLLELSKKLGISKECLATRIKRGWKQKDLAKPMLEKNKYTVIYNGKETSLNDLANMTNIPLKYLYRRIFILGWDTQKAISLPKCEYSTKIKLFNYKGQQMTITEIAKDLGIGRTTLQYRLQQNDYDLEKVLNKDWRK